SLYTRIANEILHAAVSLIGEEEALKRLTSPADDGLDKLVTIEGGQIRSVQSNPQGVAEIMLSRLTKGESPENIDLIGSAVVKIYYNHHIPPPSLKWKTDDTEQEGILIAD
ncbi:MAG: hypothetical protein HY097_11500, partial [Nitrospinae bacterium]|nr:hypothetical protein [Nitrospinota bacterium]